MKLEELADTCYENNKILFSIFWRFCDISQYTWTLNDTLNTNQMRETPDKYRNYDTNCLCLATEFSDTSFVQALLQNGARTDVTDENVDTPLHKACATLKQPVEKVKLLCLYDHSLVNRYNKSKYSPLHLAVLHKNPEVLSALLANAYCDINIPSNRFFTPLHIASYYRCYEAAQILLSRRDLNVSAQDDTGNTPMHYALSSDGYLVLCAWIRRHMTYDPHIINNDRISVRWKLHHLLALKAKLGTINEVRYLVEECDAQCVYRGFYTTPLHEAVSSKTDAFKKAEFLRLKDFKALSIKRDYCGSLPIHLAASNTDPAVLENVLFDYAYYDINGPRTDQMTALHIASWLGIVPNVNLLLKQRTIDVNVCNKDGNTPLHIACRRGYLDIILALKSHQICRTNIKNRAQNIPDDLTPNAVRILELVQTGFCYELKMVVQTSTSFTCDILDNSPLHLLCKSNKDIEDKAKLLIQCDDTQISKLNSDGLMPVHLAIKSENIPLSVFLIRNHGRDWQTTDGLFPLHIAAQFDKTNIAQQLLAICSPEEVNAKDSNGDTPAHLASMNESEDTLKAILADPKYDQYAMNKKGKTAEEINPKNICLVRFCKVGSVLSVRSMIQSGARLLSDSDGNSILYAAYTSAIDRFEKYKVLVEHQPSLVNLQNDCKETLLHRAAMDRDNEFVGFLLAQEDVDINPTDKRDMTPMHCALDRSSTEMVKLFIERGADVNIVNELGRSCLHTCIVRNQIDILKELLTVTNVEINIKDKFRRSPFQLAVDGGRCPTIWRLAFHPAFDRSCHEPDASKALLSHGVLGDLTSGQWRLTRTLNVPGYMWWSSLDLVHGHLCWSWEHGLRVYDRELREAAAYSTDLPAAARPVDMGQCFQVAALTDGQLVVAAYKGLYRITHTGIIVL